MKKLLILPVLAIGLLVLVGCGGKSGSATQQSPAADVSKLVEKSGPESQEVLTELTGSVHRCWSTTGKLPTTLEQVVSAGYLKSIPTLPAGKHYAIEPRSGQVYVVGS